MGCVVNNFTLMSIKCFINLALIELESSYLVLQNANLIDKRQLAHDLGLLILELLPGDDLGYLADSPVEVITPH